MLFWHVISVGGSRPGAFKFSPLSAKPSDPCPSWSDGDGLTLGG